MRKLSSFATVVALGGALAVMLAVVVAVATPARAQTGSVTVNPPHQFLRPGPGGSAAASTVARSPWRPLPAAAVRRVGRRTSL